MPAELTDVGSGRWSRDHTIPREEPTMTWLDDQGIAHDGEPPAGYRMLGGRWYPIDAEIDRPRHQTVRELLATG